MQRFWSIYRKEFNSFFASPAAWLFMAAFLLANLFIFFWAEAFFARNIADLKPLFEWMPVLLIFLVGTMSMRSWSEELRSGTIESLMTSSSSPLQLVLAKFLANLSLVALALLLTWPLPLTVALAGPLDWGPVIGGYTASLFLAAAYVAIGLYMSSRTDNPIVALILTVLTTGGFYLIGSGVITRLFGHQLSGLLELLGSGSRFDSITRGVLDLRDLFYYCSLVGVFLTLNLYRLEHLRWAGNPLRPRHWRWLAVCGLMIANLLVANVWLHHVRGIRVDLTEGQVFSLSEATTGYLQQASEPLLIRGYFSQKTHPLLEPLVPRLKDLLEEYQVRGGERVRVEFIDPRSDPALETEAADKYGIRPVPFRMASRYEAGIVNSYFDLLIAYGDQHETLSFDDLIEVKADTGGAEPEVLLKNPEYAITAAIRKVLQGYRAGGDVFDDLAAPVVFNAYVSPAAKLPPELASLRTTLETSLQDLVKKSAGKLSYKFADPDADGGKLGEELNQKYGFGPQVASLFDPQPFWFYMVLEGARQSITVPFPETLSEEQLQRSIESAVQRLSPGYLKTVGLALPESPPPNPYMPAPPGKQFRQLRSVLEANARVIDVDLSEGNVPVDLDMLLVLAPENLGEKARFALDQFLMQGGAVLIATSPFDVSIGRSLEASRVDSGLEDWLQSMGITINETLVLDPQNTALAIPVPRRVGPVTVNEIVQMPYPHFPDIRDKGLSQQHPITAPLRQLTLNWASPIELAPIEGSDRSAVPLVRSSAGSWTATEGEQLDIMPDYKMYPKYGFVRGLARSPQTLAVALQGHFTSYFKGKPSPLMPEPPADAAADAAPAADNSNGETPPDKSQDEFVVGSVIENSSDSARLIVLASRDFAEDSALSIISQSLGTEYTAPLEFMQNAVDWALGDADLLAIRGRTQLNRTLRSWEDKEMQTMEYTNYILAIGGLIFIWLARRILAAKRQRHYQDILKEVEAHG